ncbi:hypothetical protein [Actinomadura keratinilytica]|jgi:hypothetical protein|uniref:Uncharacterized protein n=1 Tax=Actinomadura keratinilytica TaxID=547461 RepID=A0ABP7YA98_9ACTN
MLRLYDHRTGRSGDLARGPLRIHVTAGADRALIIADLLRRVAERTGRRPAVVTRAEGVEPSAHAFADLRLPDFPVAGAPAADGAVFVGPSPGPGLSLLVPDAAPAGGDALSLRLAVLRVHYREPADLEALSERAEADLSRWRALVAEWARSPGRPMDRAYATRAQEALADDLDSPTALATLDRLAEDPDVAPGAKLETFIHLDLLLGLDLVARIGWA